MGSTWNRAAKVAETGSFEITAGGATAAVEGTLFSVVCTVNAGQTSCGFTDLFDPVTVTMNGVAVQLNSAMKVNLDQGQIGGVQNLTREDLLADVWVAGNIFLDNVLLFASPSDLPAAIAEHAGAATSASARANAGGEPAVIATDAIVVPAQYPPDGELVVDDPNIEVGGEEVFRGSGCRPGEVLTRAVRRGAGGHGAQRPLRAASPAGSRSRSDASPGQHLLTVRGSACELNAVINVLGAQAAALAFTGASNHTLTYVLVGVAAVAIGSVFVVGSRRRRASGARTPSDERRHAMSDVVDLEHRIGLLREVWLFSACNEEEIERIAAMAEPRSIEVGTEITREGDEGLEFFVVVEGDAIASVDGDEIGRIGSGGGFFGEMALIDGGERVATVTAAGPMSVLVLGRHEFNEMLEIAMPAVTPKLLAVVGARMRTIDRHAGVESTLGL